MTRALQGAGTTATGWADAALLRHLPESLLPELLLPELEDSEDLAVVEGSSLRSCSAAPSLGPELVPWGILTSGAGLTAATTLADKRLTTGRFFADLSGVIQSAQRLLVTVSNVHAIMHSSNG